MRNILLTAILFVESTCLVICILNRRDVMAQDRRQREIMEKMREKFGEDVLS